ncbi:hypothetical protein NQ318_011282 [Aromia moschata]|uniref:DUF4817 domain-containing protein n=1 Tax=Aromia moschata TaxID=1265417 RepID=A0AAV8YJV4_9CUCU|nr:hypothetical protein NQ318_011282 [Aromia moschata]
MSYLTESLKIEILMMIGYGDRARTQCEVVRLFRETHPDLPPLNQGTISKIEAQYREMGHVRKVPSKRQAVVDDDTKLNLLLALEENPITPTRQLARDSNLNHKTVLKILKYEKKRPYKMQAVQELLEDDPDRRRYFMSITIRINHYCCVPGCSIKRNPKFTFHIFPEQGKHQVSLVNKFGQKEHIDRRKAWILKPSIGKAVKCTQWRLVIMGTGARVQSKFQ